MKIRIGLFFVTLIMLQTALGQDMNRPAVEPKNEYSQPSTQQNSSTNAHLSKNTETSLSDPMISGRIHDCCCTAETVESINDKILPLLDELVETPFFRYYKMNLWRKCTLFPDDGMCSSRSCSVDECDRSEFLEVCNDENRQPENVESRVDASLDSADFHKWSEDGDPWTNDADILNLNENMNYVDLSKNPERFTGYSGSSATRIWKAIYDENCFFETSTASQNVDNVKSDQSPRNAEGQDKLGFDNFPHPQCVEKRVFYRIISGLHASISTHLTHDYTKDFDSQIFYPNHEWFYESVGKHTYRVHNLYLTYLMVLRACSKAMPYLQQYAYNTQNPSESQAIQAILSQLSSVTTTCPNTFDENTMFQGSDAVLLKKQFRDHFRNISVILDCVACERCKLWGKLQINGLGTALKILFDTKQPEMSDPATQLKLERTEVVALLHTFRRLSESLKWSNEMFRQYKHQKELEAVKEQIAASPRELEHGTSLGDVLQNVEEISSPLLDITTNSQNQASMDTVTSDQTLQEMSSQMNTQIEESSTTINTENQTKQQEGDQQNQETLDIPKEEPFQYVEQNQDDEIYMTPPPILKNTHQKNQQSEEHQHDTVTHEQHENVPVEQHSENKDFVQTVEPEQDSHSTDQDKDTHIPSENVHQQDQFDQGNTQTHQEHHDHPHDHHGHHHDHDHGHNHDHHEDHSHSHGHVSGFDGNYMDQYGLGGHGGHSHGGHNYDGPQRDLSTQADDNDSLVQELEGFDAYIHQAKELWIQFTDLISDVYVKIIQPALEKNGRWFSSSAVLAPVILLFLIGLCMKEDQTSSLEGPVSPEKVMKLPRGKTPMKARQTKDVQQQEAAESLPAQFAPTSGFLSNPSPMKGHAQSRKQPSGSQQQPAMAPLVSPEPTRPSRVPELVQQETNPNPVTPMTISTAPVLSGTAKAPFMGPFKPSSSASPAPASEAPKRQPRSTKRQESPDTETPPPIATDSAPRSEMPKFAGSVPLPAKPSGSRPASTGRRRIPVPEMKPE